MEELFSTRLSLDNEMKEYHVVFNKDLYTFHATDGATLSFSLRREHDEWHEESDLPPTVKEQAIEALEKYLMKQH